ncbi:hypothetical protein PAAG_11491 [Paracoccidioides lutzii Pb01]|uniref:N-acetyltransferase domain-containing protein n=1 Tax=Paracoccidioides lutzii (strain ATCC MYA-826 / Pb01) TaxID=502779 RepID=A0A0A2V6N9_PARBA|nr:hypothetical protein PAAG_11491 [Paracoccidioides lutzii Pb01]KGQ01770.1 hypothetical protein PAAG_11491 [Paracoccidioides lutzii Pb01]
MKRPPRLRTNTGVNTSTSSNSILWRFPLLQVNDIRLRASYVGDQVPGLRILLAFLSSLRTNIQISTSNEDLSPPSPPIPVINTPDLLKPIPPILTETNPYLNPAFSAPNGTQYPSQNPQSSTAKYASSKESSSQPPHSPTLAIFTATKEADILSALRLVSDSVAQQRQIAIKSIISHPAIQALSIITFLTIAKLLYTGSPSDLVLMLTLWTLAGLFALLAIRYMVRGYSALAEHVGNWSWLSASSVNGISHRRDEILVTKCGEDIIAVLVLRIAKTVNSTDTVCLRPRFSRRKSSARWTGIIRAWSVRQSDRHQGVGRKLLEEAVAYCRLRTLDGPIFADDHANAALMLPNVFNVKFREHERWAWGFLEAVILEQSGR